jgi:hypothetical protein
MKRRDNAVLMKIAHDNSPKYCYKNNGCLRYILFLRVTKYLAWLALN